VIAKSDLFILVVSASLLGAGIYRWQNNISLMASNGQKAPSGQRISPTENTVVSAINNNVTRTTVTTVTGVQTSSSIAGGQSEVSRVTGTSVTNGASQSDQAFTDAANIAQPEQALYGSYTVVSGDYLSKIAQQYNTTVKELQDINNINGTLIDIGQVIRYPLQLPAN